MSEFEKTQKEFMRKPINKDLLLMGSNGIKINPTSIELLKDLRHFKWDSQSQRKPPKTGDHDHIIDDFRV